MKNFGNIQEKIEQSKSELIEYHHKQIKELEEALKKQNSDLKERLAREKKKLAKDMSLVAEKAERSRVQLNILKIVIIVLISLFVGIVSGGTLVKKYIKTKTILQRVEVPIEKIIEKKVAVPIEKIIEKKVTVTAPTDIELINELNNEIDTLQSQVQDMKKWTIPEEYRVEDEDGIYLRRNKKHIFNESETDIRWIFIRKVD